MNANTTTTFYRTEAEARAYIQAHPGLVLLDHPDEEFPFAAMPLGEAIDAGFIEMEPCLACGEPKPSGQPCGDPDCSESEVSK